MNIIVLVIPQSGLALDEGNLKGTAQLLGESPFIKGTPEILTTGAKWLDETLTTGALWLLRDVDAARADGIKNQLRVIWEGRARVIWRHTSPPEADEIISSY